MIAMVLKRPELSTHSIKWTFNKSSRLPGDDVERAVWHRLKKTLETASRQEIDPSLVRKISDKPIG